MSFKADVYNVFIASPSDVSTQRDEIEKAIYEWNSLYAQNLKVVLIPRRWEKDVAPAYGNGNPQGVINKQVVYESDIVIGVFWHRMGAPTKTHLSGTLEELDYFKKNGKDVLIYFVDHKIISSDIDHDQAAKVQKYREQYGQEGIYKKYIGTTDIKEDLYRTVYNRILSEIPKIVKENPSAISNIPPEKTLLKNFSMQGFLDIDRVILITRDKERYIEVDTGSVSLYPAWKAGILSLDSWLDHYSLGWSLSNKNEILLEENPFEYVIALDIINTKKFKGLIFEDSYDLDFTKITMNDNAVALIKYHKGVYILLRTNGVLLDGDKFNLEFKVLAKHEV